MYKLRKAEREQEKEDQNSIEICRICHMEKDEERVLYHPCRCMGTIGSVHEACLRQWMEWSEHNYCEVCHYKYKFTRPYSILKVYCVFVTIFWHTFKQYCSDIFNALLKHIICYFLIPLLIADFILLIFQQQHRITDTQLRPFCKLCIGNAVCAAIALINHKFKQLSSLMQTCPKLCCVNEYQPGQMNSIAWVEGCEKKENALTSLVSCFLSTLTCHLTFIAAYVYMPYLLLCNLSKLHADNLENILSVYFITPAIIRLICTLTLVFNLKKIRFHFYVYGLYIKVIFFRSLHYFCLPFLSGIAIHCTAWLLLKQSMPKLGSTEIAWQCVKYYVTGFLFNNYLEENLRVISRYLEKSYNYLKVDATLALARTAFSKQLQQELRRVCVVAIGVLAIVWIPAYILPKCDGRQQQTLQFFYTFFYIRAGFKRFVNATKTKQRLLPACCKIMQNLLLQCPERDCMKKVRWWFSSALMLIFCGSVLVSAFCLKMLLIHQLGWYFSASDHTYSYVYGSILYYMMLAVFRMLRLFKWRHLKELMLLVCPFDCTLPIVLYLFMSLTIWTFMDIAEFSYLHVVMAGMTAFLVLAYVMCKARNGRFLRHLRLIWRREAKEFPCKLMLIFVQLFLYYIYSEACKFYVLVKLSYFDLLYSITHWIIYTDLLRIYAETKKLINPYEYELKLQDYKKNEDDKSLFQWFFAKLLELTNN